MHISFSLYIFHPWLQDLNIFFYDKKFSAKVLSHLAIQWYLYLSLWGVKKEHVHLFYLVELPLTSSL